MADQKIIGIFSSQENAINAIKRLKKDGYKDDEISVLVKDHKNMDKLSEATKLDVKISEVKEAVAGPLAAVLTGLKPKTKIRAIEGALVDLGLTKEEAEEYQGYLDREHILVMVDEYKDRQVYPNFFENESLIRDRYDRQYFEHHEDRDLNKFRDPTHGNRIIEPDNPGPPIDPENPDEPIDPIRPK